MPIAPLSRFQFGAVTTLGTEAASRGLGLLATILLIRGLRVDSYAFVVLFLAVGQFVGTSVAGGLQMRYLRTEAERVSRDHDEIKFSFENALFGGSILILALALLSLAGAIALGVQYQAAAFIALCALFSISQGAMQLTIYHYQAHLAFVKAGLINIVRSGVILIAAIVVIRGFIHSGLETAAIFTAISIVAGLIACVPLVTARNLITLSWNGLGFGSETNWLTVYYIASAGFATVDVLIVAALLHQQDVATFGAAQRYYAFALGAGPALLAVVRVRASQRDIIDAPALQLAMLRSWAKRAGIPAVVMTAVLALSAPVVIPIVNGGRYPGSIPVFQLLLIGVCAYYVMMPAASLLMAQRRYRPLALAVLGAFIANGVGDVAVVTLLDWGTVGIAGVAGVTYLGYFLATVILTMQGLDTLTNGASGDTAAVVLPQHRP